MQTKAATIARLPSQISVRRAMAQAEISKAGQQIALIRKRMDFLRATLADCDAAERLLTGPLVESLPEPEGMIDKLPHGRLRQEILHILKLAYPEMLTVSEVSEQLSVRVGARFHEKSPSMTLTRLRKDGLVALAGRRWSYINPHVSSPPLSLDQLGIADQTSQVARRRREAALDQIAPGGL